MKLEDQVCSLDLAKRLKELGVKQESLFYHYCQVGGLVVDTECRGEWIIRSHSERHKGFGEYVSAFAVAELGEMLPSHYYSDKNTDGSWNCYPPQDSVEEQSTHADTEADVRAKMLIYLIEQKLIEVSK